MLHSEAARKQISRGGKSAQVLLLSSSTDTCEKKTGISRSVELCEINKVQVLK